MSDASVKHRNPFNHNFLTYSTPEYQPAQPKHTIQTMSTLGIQLRIHPYTPVLEITTFHGDTPQQSLTLLLPLDIHVIAIIFLIDFILTFPYGYYEPIHFLKAAGFQPRIVQL